MTLIIIILAYIAGYIVSHWMLLVENSSEGGELTKGMRAIAIIYSLLSWIMVMRILVTTWVKSIAKTGYWEKPVKEITELTTVQDKANAA